MNAHTTHWYDHEYIEIIRYKPEAESALFAGKSPSDVMQICVERLQAFSSELLSEEESKERAHLKISYHPFYVTSLDDSTQKKIDTLNFYEKFSSDEVEFHLAVNRALLRAMLVANDVSYQAEKTEDTNKGA